MEVIHGGKVILAECDNQACPQNLRVRPERIYRLRCSGCGNSLTRTRGLSMGELECLRCGTTIRIPEYFVPLASGETSA